MNLKSSFLILVYLFSLLCNLNANESKEEQGPFLELHVHECSGFFAVFSSVLSVLDFYDQGSFAGVKIALDSGLYLDLEKGQNWWEYYFEPIQIGDETAHHYIFSGPEILHHTGSGFHIPRNRAYELIEKYVHLKPDIQIETGAFVENQFKDHFMIGIHHRGTDKVLEAALVPYEKTLQALKILMSSLPKRVRKNLKIYIATDEQSFLDYMLSIYPRLIIYSDFVRSTDSNSLHGSSGLYANNYQKGREALIDCLLLSKCNILIYPATSSLSVASLKFNPDLQAIPLTR